MATSRLRQWRRWQRVGAERRKTLSTSSSTHGHIDHFGGAKLIQSLSDARIGLTEADWALMEKSNRNGADAIVHKGDRDMVIRDGDVLTLGDTTLKFYITPGHTPGVASMEFPVYDQGKTYKAFLFGGHNVTSNQPEAFEMFIASVKRLQATLQDVDVSLTSHPWAADILERAEKLAARKPGDPNPYVAPAEISRPSCKSGWKTRKNRLAAPEKTVMRAISGWKQSINPSRDSPFLSDNALSQFLSLAVEPKAWFA